MATQKLHIDILARDKSKQALSQVQTRLGNLRKSVFSLRSAFVGLGAGLVVRSFVNVGKEVESLNIRFKFLFGSAEEGAKAFDNLSKFAGTVPFSLEEISRASGNLAVVSKDAEDLNRVLEITGNVAAVTGLDFETTSSQIQRAFAGGIGAADLFRERGVRALLGFEAGAKVTAEETVKRFEELFSGNGRFAGATNDLATTLEGTISMLGDKFFNFQKDVAEGFFDELKGEFGDLNEFLSQNEQQIKDIATSIGENFAGAITKTSDLIKGVAPTVRVISNALGDTIDGFNALPTFVKSSGLIAALLFGKKGMIAFAGVSYLVSQIDTLIEKSREIATEKSLLEALGSGEVDAFTLSLEEIDNLIEHIGNTSVHGTIPLGEREAATELHRILTDVRSVLKMAEADAEQYEKTFGSVNNIITETANNTKKLTEEMKKMRLQGVEMARMGTAIGTEFGKALESIDGGVERITVEKFPQFKRVLEDAGDTTKQLDGLFSKTFNGFADTLADSIMTGKFAFKDFARSVIRDIARIIAKQQALIIVQRAAGLFGGSVGGFNIGSLLPSFSSGGRVNKGMPVTVGEAGKEIFIPQSSGTIVPNNQTGGSTNINFTINTVDATGVDELLTNRRSTIINVINDALNRQGKEALV
jgi:hypothetical protein